MAKNAGTFLLISEIIILSDLLLLNCAAFIQKKQHRSAKAAIF